MKHFTTVVFGGLLLMFGAWAFIWIGGRIGAAVGAFNLTENIQYAATQEEQLVGSTLQDLSSRLTNGGVTATTYLLKDLTTGVTVDAHDEDRLVPIASLTKLVTAEVARELIPSGTEIELSPAAIATYGDSGGLRSGESLSAGELMYPLLMVSSNDAAEALARSYGRPAFLKAMNGFVQRIGAYRTYFADASGLSPQNESTADDVALILSWLRQHDPDVLDITLTKAKTIRMHTWINPTHFLSWSYYLGGKNGYTDEADRTGAALFTLGTKGEVYAIVILGSQDRDADMVRLISKVK